MTERSKPSHATPLQAFVLAITVTAAGWLGSTITKNSETNAAQESRQTQQAGDMQTFISSRNREVDSIKDDLRELSRRLASVEDRCRR